MIEGKGKNITYETSEKSFLLDKDECKNYIDYKLKICTVKDESYSDWSEIKEFKVNNLREIKNGLFFGNDLFKEMKKFE